MAETRTKAQALVMSGVVYSSSGEKLEKPGHPVSPETILEIRQSGHGWVSRGGLKLAHALSHFGTIPEGKTCLDIGASTGGFTDVLLKNSAAKVYAVDVGYGQLDWRIRNDPRVQVMEKTNARHLTREQIPEPVNIITCDASFIGLETVLPASFTLAAPEAQLIALIKPQFEVGKERVGKKGVVRDPELHKEVCERISAWLAGQGFRVSGITESPVLGPEGNKEFLIHGVMQALGR